MAAPKSMNSSQSQVGVTASTWALASMNKWLDTGMDAARAKPMTLSQPVMPPIFMRSGIMRSQAPALRACSAARGNHQFSPVWMGTGLAARTRACPCRSSAATGSSTHARSNGASARTRRIASTGSRLWL